jgi:ATP-dependent RNA helicase SUPV3L1/SUV3
MQQRRLRLGDILDDYCPRERRITNHAVVAMIEDTVKQTRCTTCDADHEYKHAKVPAARRRKTGALGAQLVEGSSRLPAPAEETSEEMVPVDELSQPAAAIETPEPTELSAEPASAPDEAEAANSENADADPEDADADRDEWPVHRPLIRATLPRPEGQTPERKAPDFTFRPAGGKFDSARNGQRNRGHRPARQAQGQHGQASGQGQRFGGHRPAGQGQRGPGQGGAQGQRHGNRPGQSGSGRPGQGRGPRPGGGRKRGR